ncbi:MAG: hypothetical protein IJ571_07480 [Ruminococcus sp.]|nr:hypothetical protein [Ruminococcus sp.]
MLQILADDGATLQNVYAPLPLGIHIGFCIIATAVYAALFARRRGYNYLCLLAAVDLTLLTQFFTDDSFITALFIVELGLLAASAIYSFRASRAKKEQKAAADNKDEETEAAEEKAEASSEEPEDTEIDSDAEDDDIL